jgi:hypothetical protein
MIERLNSPYRTPEATKIDEIIDAVNGLEATVYAAPDDDICDDCAFDALLDELQDLDDAQLMVVSAEANRLREERSQEAMKGGIEDEEDQPTPDCARCGSNRNNGEPYCSACLNDLSVQDQPETATIDTKDGLLSAFVAYVAEHPDLRFFQAICAWSGYRSLYGEVPEGGLKDLFYETTKGPAA